MANEVCWVLRVLEEPAQTKRLLKTTDNGAFPFRESSEPELVVRIRFADGR